MEWFCCEGDLERLSSLKTMDSISQSANSSGCLICPPRSPPLRGQSPHLRASGNQSGMFVAMTYKGQLFPSPGGTWTFEHTSWILFQMTISLSCQPLSHLSPVSHFIFCNKFLLGNYNSLRLEALIRNHLSHVKTWVFFWSEGIR